MREIKFRGQRLDNKKWVYGGISIFESEATIFDCNCVVNSAYDVSLASVGQFTGLKDKNGVDIYMGDIVKFKSSSSTPINIIHEGKELTAYEPIFNIGCVVFYKGSFGLHNEFDTDSHLENSKYNGTSYYGNIQNNEYRMEVIGNIYENPELLK